MVKPNNRKSKKATKTFKNKMSNPDDRNCEFQNTTPLVECQMAENRNAHQELSTRIGAEKR